MPNTARIKKRRPGDLKHLGTIKKTNKQEAPALKPKVTRVIMVAAPEGRCVVATIDTEPEEETPTSSASTSSAIARSNSSEDEVTVEDTKPEAKMPSLLSVASSSSAITSKTCVSQLSDILPVPPEFAHLTLGEYYSPRGADATAVRKAIEANLFENLEHPREKLARKNCVRADSIHAHDNVHMEVDKMRCAMHPQKPQDELVLEGRTMARKSTETVDRLSVTAPNSAQAAARLAKSELTDFEASIRSKILTLTMINRSVEPAWTPAMMAPATVKIKRFTPAADPAIMDAAKVKKSEGHNLQGLNVDTSCLAPALDHATEPFTPAKYHRDSLSTTNSCEIVRISHPFSPSTPDTQILSSPTPPPSPSLVSACSLDEMSLPAHTSYAPLASTSPSLSQYWPPAPQYSRAQMYSQDNQYYQAD